LEFEHIVEWAKVQEHTFENMIVLCANCHRRKKDTSDPKHINRASLTKIKQDLMMLNGRYSDLEKRVIQEFKDASAPVGQYLITLSYFRILLQNLEHDGYFEFQVIPSPMSQGIGGISLKVDHLLVKLTQAGKSFIDNLEN